VYAEERQREIVLIARKNSRADVMALAEELKVTRRSW
jgi:DeoR/GlpR family transcriptional regulator of sugar metabolism